MTNIRKEKINEGATIDIVLKDERHGKPFSQFTLWFGANLQITAIVTGALAVVLGGDAFWSITGLMLGQLIGGAIMALHAMQGPKLGLPQMIASRAQFGVLGASIPTLLVCILYIGFNTTGITLAGQSISHLLHINSTSGILVFSVIIIVSAMFGYRFIHCLGRIATVLGIITFTYIFIQIVMVNDLNLLLEKRFFSWGNFLFAISLSASWQIAYSPYASDYSRYLPKKTSPTKVFFSAWLGSVLGSQISMTFGVFAAILAGQGFSGNEVGYIVSLGGNSTKAAFLYFSIAFGKVTISTLNAYGSLMCLTTIINSFKAGVRLNKYQKLCFIFVTVGISTCFSLLLKGVFLHAFKHFLFFLLTFFTPWAAMNITSFYFTYNGHYNIHALMDPNGCYGRWNFFGIGVYFIGVLVQIPFFSSTFYTGPIYNWLDTDISWFVGLIIPTMLCCNFGSRKGTVAKIWRW